MYLKMLRQEALKLGISPEGIEGILQDHLDEIRRQGSLEEDAQAPEKKMHKYTEVKGEEKARLLKKIIDDLRRKREEYFNRFSHSEFPPVGPT